MPMARCNGYRLYDIQHLSSNFLFLLLTFLYVLALLESQNNFLRDNNLPGSCNTGPLARTLEEQRVPSRFEKNKRDTMLDQIFHEKWSVIIIVSTNTLIYQPKFV